MQRTKRSTAVAVLPSPPAGGTPGYFAQPNPQGGVPATVPGYEWYNNVQEELLAVIEGQGLVASDTDRTQLRQAIGKMIQAGQRSVIIGSATFAPAVTGTGKAVYWDSGNGRFDLALADGSAKQNCIGFADVPNGNIYAFGDAVLFAGLSPGSRYYLDGATAGVITTTVPASNTVFVGIARNATELFVDIDSQPTATVATVQGAYKNLQLSAGGTAASISVSYDELVLGDGNGNYVTERNVAGTITTTNTGAGGLDTGALAASTWYSIWRIGKTDGTRAWLFSLSATAPTMPSGYALKARLGWFRTDGTANKYPLSFIQFGRSVRYKPAAGSNLTAAPQMASGAAGTVGTTLVSIAVGTFIPPTASIIKLQTYTGGGGAVQVNSSSVASITGTTGFDNTTPAGATPTVQGDLMLESTNIYWASNSASSAIYCSGWEDSL